jgi:hypothetical protein
MQTGCLEWSCRVAGRPGKEKRMSDPPPELRPDARPPAGTPRWVKILGVVLLLLVLLVAVLHLTGNSMGPGSHLGAVEAGLQP